MNCSQGPELKEWGDQEHFQTLPLTMPGIVVGIQQGEFCGEWIQQAAKLGAAAW